MAFFVLYFASALASFPLFSLPFLEFYSFIYIYACIYIYTYFFIQFLQYSVNTKYCFVIIYLDYSFNILSLWRCIFHVYIFYFFAIFIFEKIILYYSSDIFIYIFFIFLFYVFKYLFDFLFYFYFIFF